MASTWALLHREWFCSILDDLESGELLEHNLWHIDHTSLLQYLMINISISQNESFMMKPAPKHAHVSDLTNQEAEKAKIIIDFKLIIINGSIRYLQDRHICL